MDRIIAIRRADGVEAQGKRPVLRKGDRGAFVHDLQAQLAKLGYTLGKQDGQFGARTLAAVVAFQADNDISADGIVGDRTWTALSNAEARPLRAVSKADLKDSRTIKAADEGKVITAGAAGLGTAYVAVETAEQVADVAQRAGGLVQGLLSVGPWPLLALAVIGIGAFLLWRRFGQIEDARIEDARTGANDSR